MSKIIERPEKGILTGDVCLTPVQQWFFERKLKNENYFNQSVMLKLGEKITLNMVKSIFNVIAQYHDVFRMRYELNDEKYVQSYTNNLSISVEEKKMQLDEISDDASNVQASLNIFDGPIVRVVVYRCENNQDRMLVVAHHLVVDGVSWRILIDDIETIYNAFMESGRIALPAKTHSYRQWVNALRDYADSEEGLNEVSYWENVENSINETILPFDFEESSSNVYDGISISLNEEETRQLIKEVPKKYNTQINDILLTALTKAVGGITGNYEFSFTLEGHGREDVIGLDVSRTIGWFTSIFPVVLKMSNPEDLIKSINEVKQSLKKIPDKGVGYGILKYYNGSLKKPLPRISFNYLGQWDSVMSESSIFQYASESAGGDCDERNGSYNLIDMNGGIRDSIFEMGFAYNTGFYKKTSVEKLAEKFKITLLEIINK